MAGHLPYVTSPGTLRTMLDRMKDSILPEKFTGEFVETKLKMKGGSARSTIPFIRKMNLIQSDGAPTELYKEFRNKTKSGYAIAKATKIVYRDLFEQNEYAYELSDEELLGLIIQITGSEEQASATKLTVQTFKVLKEFADFEEVPKEELNIALETSSFNPLAQYQYPQSLGGSTEESINLSYTINLNLPATTNIEVFNAIFKSLKENLLKI